MSYTWQGLYGDLGTSGPNGRTAKINGNKGVMDTRRAEKRAQAEARNARTSPERRRQFARQYGYSRNSERIANGLEL